MRAAGYRGNGQVSDNPHYTSLHYATLHWIALCCIASRGNDIIASAQARGTMSTAQELCNNNEKKKMVFRFLLLLVLLRGSEFR